MTPEAPRWAPTIVVFSTSTPWGVLTVSLETWGLGGEKTDRDGAHDYPGSALTTVVRTYVLL